MVLADPLPSRDADLHTELTCLVVIYLDGDVAVPRVLCILTQGNLLAGYFQRRRVAEEEVDIYILILYGIYVAWEGWQEAADVARAAGTAEPSLTLVLTHTLQWVRVEEAAAVHAHTTDETIVEGTLQYIVILTLAMEEEETVVDINIADSCAGFAVGTHVRQLVVLSESLAVVGGSYTSGDVEFLAYDVVPDAVDGVDIGSITGEGCYICHTCIHIGSTYGMTYSLVLLQNRFVALRIFLFDRCLATIVEEELCLIEIFLVACSEIELAECHFGNLMSRYHASLSWVRTNLANHAVGIADSDVEELAATCSLPVSYGTFYHVTEVVELVAQILFLAPALVASPEMRMLRILCTGGIEISVSLLSRSDDVEHAVDISLEFLVWISLQHVAGTLNRFVWVGVVEAVGHQFAHIIGVAWMSGTLKVLVSSLRLAFAESQRYSHLARGFDTLSPERIVPNLY